MTKEQKLCAELGHKWDEYHVYEVVCSRCRTCREWTNEDEEKFKHNLIIRN